MLMRIRVKKLPLIQPSCLLQTNWIINLTFFQTPLSPPPPPPSILDLRVFSKLVISVWDNRGIRREGGGVSGANEPPFEGQKKGKSPLILRKKPIRIILFNLSLSSKLLLQLYLTE